MISLDREEAFERFALLLKAQRNVKDSTVETYLNVLKWFNDWCELRGVGFGGWNAELVTKYVAKFSHPSTRHQVARTLKDFFRTLGYADAEDIKVPPQPKAELPDILSEEQVLRLADACANVRDRTLILVTYESTRRNHEVLGVRICDVKFDDYGALVTFHSNKSEGATIRCVLSASALQKLIELHPSRDKPESPLFLGSRFGRPLSPSSFRWILQEASKRADVYISKDGKKKAVWPHLLRHSGIAAMKMATDGNGGLIYNDDDIMNCSGHRTRKMLDRYGKVTMTLTNNRRLVAAGLKQVEEKQRDSVRKCPRCGYVNGPLDKYCSQCTLPLSAKEINEEDKLLSRIKTLFPIVGAFDFFKDVTDNAYKRLDEIAEQTAKRLKG